MGEEPQEQKAVLRRDGADILNGGLDGANTDQQDEHLEHPHAGAAEVVG
jgi:hypothetical protein